MIVEIGKSSRPHDLGPKKADYRRAGVPEYLFVGLDPDEVRWFALRGGRFVQRRPLTDDVYRSEVFPGLWLDALALFANEMTELVATLERGLATPEHKAFVHGLEAIKSSKTGRPLF